MFDMSNKEVQRNDEITKGRVIVGLDGGVGGWMFIVLYKSW